MPYFKSKRDDAIITQLLNTCSDLNLNGVEALRALRLAAASLESSIYTDDYTDFE